MLFKVLAIACLAALAAVAVAGDFSSSSIRNTENSTDNISLKPLTHRMPARNNDELLDRDNLSSMNTNNTKDNISRKLLNHREIRDNLSSMNTNNTGDNISRKPLNHRMPAQHNDELLDRKRRACDSSYSECCNGGCVRTSYIRDGDDDCGDGSDETSPAFQCASVPPKKSDGSSCSSSSQCSSNDCRGSNCCNSKGQSAGCTDCDSDGDCATCSSGYTRTSYECFQNPKKFDGSSCSSSSQCSSNDCRGSNCCNSKGQSAGCTDCDSDGDCATCSSGYTRTSYECFQNAPPTPPPKKSDGSSCSSSSQCSSNDCRGSNCCNSKGQSAGCTDCDSDGDCATCSSGYTKTSYECFRRDESGVEALSPIECSRTSSHQNWLTVPASSECNAVAAKVNNLPGVSGVDCYIENGIGLLRTNAGGGPQCRIVSAALNKLSGVSGVGCGGAVDKYIMVPAGSSECNSVDSRLNELLVDDNGSDSDSGSSISDGGSCSSSSSCSSGTCRGGNCCNSKGQSAGCTDCDSDGNCATCSSGYTRTSYECFQNPAVTPAPRGCASSYSECCNGGCVRTSYIRDGDDDCGDGSDETSPAFQCASAPAPAVVGDYCHNNHNEQNPCATDDSDFCCDSSCTYCGPKSYCELHSPFKEYSGTCSSGYSSSNVCKNHYETCDSERAPPTPPPKKSDGSSCSSSSQCSSNETAVAAAAISLAEACEDFAFGTIIDGVCHTGDHERTSMIRCSGDSSHHYGKWLKKARKRKGKNHEFVENVTWVEYFKHEYSENYGKRPAEGPSGFGAMYVPGKTKACEKVRDTLNGLFDPPAWICTPTCKNKFSTKSKCKDKSRKERRIRRLADNTAAERYILRNGSEASAIWHYDASSYLENSLVGDLWKEGLKEKEEGFKEMEELMGDYLDSSSEWKNWRKATRVVGLDYRDCECQEYGDSHLTYGYVPDENGSKKLDPDASQSDRWNGTDVASLPFGSVEVGAKGDKHNISREFVTLKDHATFSCNAVTDDISTFEDNSDAKCMKICRETVKTLRSLQEILSLEEDDTYTPFYIAMGVIVPVFFLCCTISDLGEGSDSQCTFTPFILTCKIFDWMSDWAFYAVSLQQRGFTEFSRFGSYRDNNFEQIQKASLAFCIIGTFLVIGEWYGFGGIKGEESFGLPLAKNGYHMRRTLGILVILFEDLPQLVLCVTYLDGMKELYEDQEGGFKFADDRLSVLSLVLSAFSLTFNLANVVRNHSMGNSNNEANFS